MIPYIQCYTINHFLFFSRSQCDIKSPLHWIGKQMLCDHFRCNTGIKSRAGLESPVPGSSLASCWKIQCRDQVKSWVVLEVSVPVSTSDSGKIISQRQWLFIYQYTDQNLKRITNISYINSARRSLHLPQFKYLLPDSIKGEYKKSTKHAPFRAPAPGATVWYYSSARYILAINWTISYFSWCGVRPERHWKRCV